MTRTEAERLAADMNATRKPSVRGEYSACQLGSDWVVCYKEGGLIRAYHFGQNAKP